MHEGQTLGVVSSIYDFIMGVHIDPSVLGVFSFLAISVWYMVPCGRERGSAVGIWVKRYLRLYPAYLACITLAYLSVLLIGSDIEVTLKTYLLNLTMLTGFAGGRIPYVDGAHWYVTVLLQVSIVLLFVERVFRSKARYAYLVWLLLPFILRVLPDPLCRLNEFLPSRQAGFVVAVLAVKRLYVSVEAEGWRVRGWRNWFPRLFDMGLVVLAFAYHALKYSPPAAVNSAVALGVFLLCQRNLLGFLSWRPLVWFGSISYPIYLLHQRPSFGILLQLDHFFGHASMWHLLVPFVVLIPAAMSIHRYVEAPANRYLRKF